MPLIELAGTSLWLWMGFLLFIAAMLALDLGVFHKNSHEVSFKESLIWTGVWIALALTFNALLYFGWTTIHPSSSYSPKDAGMAFLVGYLIEKSLSVDNIFVILMIFGTFAVPKAYQHKVLFWGILGAVAFRALFVALGSALLESFKPVILIFGALLLLTGLKMLLKKGEEKPLTAHPAYKFIQKHLRLTPHFEGDKFFVRRGSLLFATPLFACLIMIELTDVVFAVDSVPAIFAVTRDPFIVFTSNIFAILGLRAMFFAVTGLTRLFTYLQYGLGAILIFVGAKMAAQYWHYKVPTALSLGIILGILALSVLASKIWPPKESAPRHHEPIVKEPIVNESDEQDAIPA